MKKDEAVPDDPPPAVFQQSRALLDLRASILNEHDYDSNGFASPIEQQPVGPTPPLLDTLVPRNRPPVLPKPRMVPGEAISPETLRKLRAAAFLPISQNGRPPGLPPQANAQPTFQSKRTAYEVIDLT
jgi:hypothetical protein